MRQNIQLQPEYHSAFLESALSEYFRHAGDRFAEESAVFSTAVRCVLASEGHLSNKAIILWLIQTLEATHDVVQADVIRKTLEIVVSALRVTSGAAKISAALPGCIFASSA